MLSNCMARVLIIGYGNPLRGDDGFGWHVAQALLAMPQEDGVEIQQCHQLTPDLAEPLSRAHYAIFVDAADDGTPGKLTLDRIHPRERVSRFSHHATPGSVLAYAHKLYGHLPHEAYLLTVGARDLDVSERLSDVVERMVPVALAQIAALCATMHADAKTPNVFNMVVQESHNAAKPLSS